MSEPEVQTEVSSQRRALPVLQVEARRLGEARQSRIPSETASNA